MPHALGANDAGKKALARARRQRGAHRFPAIGRLAAPARSRHLRSSGPAAARLRPARRSPLRQPLAPKPPGDSSRRCALPEAMLGCRSSRRALLANGRRRLGLCDDGADVRLGRADGVSRARSRVGRCPRRGRRDARKRVPRDRSRSATPRAKAQARSRLAFPRRALPRRFPRSQDSRLPRRRRRTGRRRSARSILPVSQAAKATVRRAGAATIAARRPWAMRRRRAPIAAGTPM